MKKIVLSLLTLLFASTVAFAQSDLQVLATIKLNKSESITVKQVKTRVSTYEKQTGAKFSVEDRKKVLDSLVEEKLMLQAAQKAGISIPESAADQYFIQMMSQQVGANVTLDQLEQLVMQSQGITLDQLLTSQVGMNVKEYKDYLKNQLIIQQYIISQKQQEMMKLAPTDEEIHLYYENNKKSFVWNDMMKVFMVIVPKANQPEEAKLKLNDLRNKLVGKKMTSEQITAQSANANSGYQAGEMLLPKTDQAAQSIGMTYQNLVTIFNQKEGFVSDIQETPVDFRIISVEKKYSAKLLELSDVVQPETTMTVYEYIRGNLGQQKQMQYIQYIAKQMAAEINTPANVEFKKTGSALDSLLAWGE